MAHRPWGPKRQQRSVRILKRLVERPAEERQPLQYLLPLRRGEELTINGGLEVRVVRGAVEIWGAARGPSPEFTRVVAPAWSALPRLRATGAEGPAAAASEAGEPQDEPEDVRHYLQSHAWPVVLCVRAASPSPAHGSTGDAATLARERLLAPAERPRLRAHSAWPSLAERFLGLATRAAPGRPPVLLVTGPKGTGKSACCRYFANALLSALGEVYFLETDLGQPELGLPGLVAVHRLRQPMLQAPHSEQNSHECLASFFAGGTSPAVHPSLYARCLRAAFNRYVDECSDCDGSAVPPLVVNSHGWVTGLGLELVQVLQGVVRAQLVVRIHPASSWQATAPSKPSAAKASLELTTVAKKRRTALARCGPLALQLGSAASTASSEPCASVVVDMGSLAGAVDDTQPKGAARQHRSLGPSELRWLRLACYFRPDLDACRPPTSLAPRVFFRAVPRARLPLRGLRFGLAHGSLVPGEVEAAFTGAVVSLCRLEAPAGADPREGAGGEAFTIAGGGTLAEPRVLGPLDATEAPQCVGMAFVHSFDFAAGEVEVRVAPGVERLLAGVDAVLRGDMSWEPHSVRGQRVFPNGTAGDGIRASLQPYCCSWTLEGPATGAKVLSTRRNLKRKRSGMVPGAAAAPTGGG